MNNLEMQLEIQSLEKSVLDTKVEALIKDAGRLGCMLALAEKLAEAETREDAVRKENDGLTQDVIAVEKAMAIMATQLSQTTMERDQAIQREEKLEAGADYWRELNAAHIRELDDIHKWLEDCIYPHLEGGRKVFDQLQECKNAFNTVGGEYPW